MTIYLDDTLTSEELAEAAAEVRDVSRPTGYDVEAQNLRATDRITLLQGRRFEPAGEITELDMSDRAHGWVWVKVRRFDVGTRGHYVYTARLGIYESVKVL